ncbi:protein maelstrom homolog [Panulirus ornatus]|uniref:protein maelstrom homolog n=1 Tax=Panulirus ornatus TaxID=150431 RepID=UPI003A88C5C9
MGRKKQQYSDFYFFMVEKKPEVEKRLGRGVSMAELPDLLYPEWKALPEMKKQKYKAMKEKCRGTAEKLDCRGLPLAELKRREEEKKKKVEEMIQSIVNTIDAYNSSNALHRATFYIISTSYYVHTEDDYFSPAEIGLVQFSFERGIIKEHHVIVSPIIPTGYGYASQQHSEATHNLLDENSYGVDDKLEVFQGLKDFVIEEGSRLPPLYTLDEEMVHTEAIINDIAGMEYFRIFSLDKLFQHLYSTTFPEHPIPQSVAKDMLTNCSLDYHPTIACQWHINYQKDAGKYCSLSCARRWVFLMCDNMNLADKFGVEPLEDKHLPRALPSCGVLVDVPRTTFRKERITSHNLDLAGSSQMRKVAAVASDTSSPRACSASSLFSGKLDTSSEEEFPTLGAGVARKDADGRSYSRPLMTRRIRK